MLESKEIQFATNSLSIPSKNSSFIDKTDVKRVVIFGDSHVSSLSIAIHRLRHKISAKMLPLDFAHMLAPATDFYEPFHECVGGKIRFTNETMIRRGKQLLDEDGFLFDPTETLSILSLGLHTGTFLVGHRWVTHAHWRTNAARTRASLSDRVFEGMVLESNRHVLRFLEDMKSLGYNVAILSSPPPTNRFSLFDLGYSKADVILQDGLAREVMKRRFADMHLAIIDAPDEAKDSQGFLKEEFLMDDERDKHHGNLKYSTLLLRDIALSFGIDLKSGDLEDSWR